MKTTTRLEVESTTEFDGGGLMQVSIHVGDLGTTTDAERQLLSTLLGMVGDLAALVPAATPVELPGETPAPEPVEAPEPPSTARSAARPKASKVKPAKVERAPAARPTARALPKPDSDGGIVLLRGLHDLGGEILDPSGRATSKLLEHVAWDRSDATARNLLAALADAGHITRTVSGKRTTRLALRPSGLAVLDGLDDADASRRAAEQLDGDLGPTAEPSGNPACPRCERAFTTGDVVKRLRQHLVTAHGVTVAEAKRMVAEVA